MKHKLLATLDGARRFILVFDVDDDVLAELHEFCERVGVNSASLYGIGGFRRVTLGYYDMDAKQYRPIEIEEQVEVVSFIANLTLFEGKPRVHAHCVVGHRDGHTSGGHLMFGAVRPTLEVVLQEIRAMVQRTNRPDIGIPLIDL